MSSGYRLGAFQGVKAEGICGGIYEGKHLSLSTSGFEGR